MSNLRSPLWRTSYQRSFLFVFQTRHSPVVHVGQRAELITHKVGKGRLKFIDEKKQNKITCCRDWPTRTDERLKSGWNYWANILSVTDISAHYFGQHSQIFQCMHRVDIMCKVPTVALILVTNLADLKLWTEFYLLKLMDIMVNTKQNMMKIRSLSNCW